MKKEDLKNFLTELLSFSEKVPAEDKANKLSPLGWIVALIEIMIAVLNKLIDNDDNNK